MKLLAETKPKLATAVDQIGKSAKLMRKILEIEAKSSMADSKSLGPPADELPSLPSGARNLKMLPQQEQNKYQGRY